MSKNNAWNLPLTDILHGTNPRREQSAQAFRELVESVIKVGVLQPILVRPFHEVFPGQPRYEVVCGHRRLAAAREAGLETIPAILRDLTDDEAAQIALIENLQREDLTPIDEATGYQALLDRGMTVSEIASGVHRAPATIYGRLQLLNLPEAAVEALRDGTLGVAIATEIGKLPSEQHRKLATKRILDGDEFDDRPFTFLEAKRLIRDEFMLDLTAAPFSPSDSDLLPDVGACTHCPHRTGNSTDLFGDIVAEGEKGADVCVNPPCFENKKKAQAERDLDAARLRGLRILSDKERKGLFLDGSCRMRWNSKYVNPSEMCEKDPKRRTWERLLGADGPEPVVAIDGTGAVRLLIARGAAQKALEEKHDWAKRSAGTSERSGRRPDPRREREDKIRAQVHIEIMNAFVAIAEGQRLRTPSKEEWKVLAAAAVLRSWDVDRKASCSRLHLESAGGRPAPNAKAKLLRWLGGEECSGAAARGLLVYLLMRPFMELASLAGEKQLQSSALEAFGIDRKAIEAKVRAAVKSEQPKQPARRRGEKETS